MKPIGMLYATREGHTRHIADYVADNLRARGLEVQVKNVADGVSSDEIRSYSAVVLAASVHAGAHEAEMIRFVRWHLAELERLPSAFISVTLSEAGAERANATPQEHAAFAADVQKVIDLFLQETGWHPKRIKAVAGALLYTKYNFFIRFIMKRIARKAGAATDTSRDYEYTDWRALREFVGELADEVESAASQNQPAR